MDRIGHAQVSLLYNHFKRPCLRSGGLCNYEAQSVSSKARESHAWVRLGKDERYNLYAKSCIACTSPCSSFSSAQRVDDGLISHVYERVDSDHFGTLA